MLMTNGSLPRANATPSDSRTLAAAFERVRADSERICAPLEIEDYGIQTMADVSPPKWHLAHTSWFFETFLLKPYLGGYREFHPLYAHLFNSYYETAGTYHPRPERGLLARPTVEQVYAYRAHIDEHMLRLLTQSEAGDAQAVAYRATLGMHHEQQHQELLLTDIKHIFAYNPLRPAYMPEALPVSVDASDPPLHFIGVEGGVKQIGSEGAGFAYDNETPCHRVYVDDFRLGSRLITNGEYRAFIEDGGYSQPQWWLSDAWKTVQVQQWQAPLYWEPRDGEWWQMTLRGMSRVDDDAPVCHVSYYEADAFARWAGKRLPTEAEWEIVAAQLPVTGNLRERGALAPQRAQNEQRWQQIYGDVWEWTQSPYAAYPGYRPLEGTLGEYNGKFMSSQMVLRGGSCVTPPDHIRATYRNFFYPGDRWQFSGIRLAEDGL